ncbi:MAG TPA: site-specific DNA-methyltransferase, partial [Candidatus Saccharimonadales bacterium]|nr:site-specific DNA-methyltransferase [Candidatus Saccharimonadales bacterium]
MGLKKLDGQSENITEDQKTKLKELFPEVFAEDKIDWNKLKSTLGKEVDLEERYGLNWKGKSNVFRAIQELTTKTLKPVRNESVNFGETENLFIEGDNLEVLKVLQRSYYGKVKMIYIDPPYNTGNDFVYNDKFAQSKIEYEEEAGIRDEEGKITRTDGLKPNRRDGGHFHSNWLNMMYPRLFLARNLLKKDGVIFISIDDNEVHNLRMIMNEIFGEENFLSEMVRKTKLTSNKGTHFSPSHEYILVYARQASELAEFNDIEAQNDPNYLKLFKFKDDRGKYNEVSLYMPSLDVRPNQRYWIEAPDGSKVITPEGKVFRWTEETFLRNKNDGRVVFKKTDTSPLLSETNEKAKWNVYTKLYLHERQESGLRPVTFFDKYPNSIASKELIKLKIPFS